jgi:hypothetical protein
VTPPGPTAATAQHAGRACPYCRFSIKQGIEIVECGSCHSVHHAECWDDNEGCAVLGCSAGPSATASPPAAGGARPNQAAAPARRAPPPAAAPPSRPAPAAPAPAGNRRNQIVLAVCAVVVLAATATVAAVIAGRGKDAPSAQQPPVTGTPSSGTATAAPGSGTVPAVDGGTPPAQTESRGILATVARTCGADGTSDCFVSLRIAPTGGSRKRRQLDEGAKVRVVCQLHGENAHSSVLRGSSDVWARTPGGSYLANVYLDAKGLDPFRITLPVCE